MQPWRTLYPIWNQPVVPCPVLTVASWPAYGFLKRQVRWSGICHQLGVNGPWCFQGDLNKAFACDICKIAEFMYDGTKVFFLLVTWLCLWCSIDFEGFLYWTKQSVTLTMPCVCGLACFLTCIQISQEADQVVWCSHLFQNFPQFILIHTVKGFGIVNKAEIDVFLELSCFFDDPVDVGNLISGSSVFSKTSLNIWSSWSRITEAYLGEFWALLC